MKKCFICDKAGENTSISITRYKNVAGGQKNIHKQYICDNCSECTIANIKNNFESLYQNKNSVAFDCLHVFRPSTSIFKGEETYKIKLEKDYNLSSILFCCRECYKSLFDMVNIF